MPAMTVPAPPLSVLHRDEDLLVVDKPSGMVVHKGWARDEIAVVTVLRQQLDLAKVHTVHRLDRQTSGALVVGLRDETVLRFSHALPEAPRRTPPDVVGVAIGEKLAGGNG